MVVISIILIGLLTVQIYQFNQLSNQKEQAKEKLSTAKVSSKKSTDIEAKPTQQLESAKTASDKVSEFVNLFSNSSAHDYDKKLSGLASSTVISKLKTELAPSVTFEQRSNYQVVTVVVDRVWDNVLNYNVIAKSDTQSVSYLVSYDLTEKQVTNVERLPISGEYHE